MSASNASTSTKIVTTQQLLPLSERCSCGSVPTIDISSILVSSSPTLPKEEREQLKIACQTHGYFFITLSKQKLNALSSYPSYPNNSDNNINAKLNVFLDKESKETDRIITGIFKERERKDKINYDNPSSPSNKCNDPGIETYLTENKDTLFYRGPMSESGNPNSASYEPKQSLELFRCCSSSSGCEEDGDNAKNVRLQCPLHWNIIRDWVEAFHTLSIIVSNMLLQLPKDFIVSNTCPCNNDSNVVTSNNNKNVSKRCNLDLLRIFRYDSIEKDNINANRLGSSPHTDWGSFTIIWQSKPTNNSKSLQTYCQKHKIWNNVNYPETKGTHFDDNNSDSNEYFLIHIGDFTSLASQSYYTSPRHRVCCSNATRNSLVYFVYPHLDITLENAQQQMEKKDNEIKQYDTNLEMYSLLQNQSMPSCSSMNNHNHNQKVQYWNEIKELPFNTVIDDKWNQVQRKN